MSNKFRRLLAGASTVILFVIGIQLFGTASADAHTNIVTGTSQCAVDGTYTVTWTISNNYTKSETATVTGHTPAASLLSANSVPLPAVRFSTATITQTGILGSIKHASLTVSGKWSDGYSVTDSAGLTLAGTCLPSKTPTAPTYTNGACSPDFTIVKPTLTIPSDSGVTYAVNGTTRAAGTYQVTAGDYTVTASSPGYVLTPSTWGPWHITEQAGDCLTSVTPVSPTIVQATCTAGSHTPTIPTVTATDTAEITYQVGTIEAGQPVTVTATATAGHKFDSLPDGWVKTDSTHASLTFTLDAAPDCRATTTPVAPTVTQTVCSATGTTPVAPTLALPADTADITYTATAGPYTAGGTATVTATAQSGYKFATDLPTGWSRDSDTSASFGVVFTAAPDCTQSVSAAKATFSVQECTSGATLKPGSYTVPTSKGIDYLVNGKVAKAGTYTAKPGSTVIVVAKAKPGYALSGTARWSFTFGKAKQCSNVDSASVSRPPSSSASASNSTSHGVDAATTSQPPLATTGVQSSSLLTLAVGLLVAGIGITMLASVNRRRRPGGPRH